MNSLCKQYISEVKLLLPAIGKSEKNYLASLTSNLEDSVMTPHLRQLMTYIKNLAHL